MGEDVVQNLAGLQFDKMTLSGFVSGSLPLLKEPQRKLSVRGFCGAICSFAVRQGETSNPVWRIW
jgi:hypothetical protein